MTIGLWDEHDGGMAARIELMGEGGNWAEAVIEWLVDEDREGRYWRVAGVSTWDGGPLPEGYDEVVVVWRVDNGVS